MLASLFSILLASQGQATDFGIRSLGGSAVRTIPAVAARADLESTRSTTGTSRGFTLASATRVASRFGRVTSTVRSREHNRRVGGAPNSWHLHGRAIDIARQPGVSHTEIAAELRRQGFILIESLDEGDHSHFAFANGLPNRRPARNMSEQVAELRQEASYFRFVSAPSAPRLAGSVRFRP